MRRAARHRRLARSGRLRVALVSPSLNPGGAERQMLILAAALPRDSFDLRFVLIAERGLLAGEADALGIPVHVLGLGTRRCRRPSPSCLGAVARAVVHYLQLTRDVDIVDASLVPALTFAGLAQPIARVPVFIAGRRSLASVARPVSRARRIAASLAMRRAHAFVANSDAAAKDLIAVDRVDARRIHVIPNAVVPVGGGSRDRLRSEWGAGPDDLVIGCVANYKPGKGLPELLSVAADLRERLPNLHWVLVGDGPLHEALAEMIRERHLEANVVLQVGVTDARRLYAGFDIAVQASESEGMPNAVLEAAAAGLPIIATAVGGTAEIVEHGQDGLLVRPGDTSGIAEAIIRLATDTPERHRLGHAASDRALAFSATALAERTGALYLKLAGWPAPRSGGQPPGPDGDDHQAREDDKDSRHPQQR